MRGLVLLLIVLAGCGGPGVGTVVTLQGRYTPLYIDRGLYAQKVEAIKAGSKVKVHERARPMTDYDMLMPGVEVRVLARDAWGVKVVVEASESGNRTAGGASQNARELNPVGKIGWITTEDLTAKP